MAELENKILKITSNPWNDYQSWLECGKPFAFGKELIKRYTRNQKLKKYFHGRRESEKDAVYLDKNLQVIFIKWKK